MDNNIISINLFRLLDENQVHYAVLRNYKSLPNNLGGSDLDLWVSSESVHKFNEVIIKLADQCKASLVSYLADEQCPKVCLLNTDNGIQIDVFKGNIPYQNTIMITENVIKKNLSTYNGISILDDKLANLIAFLKEIINNGTCSDKYINPILESSSHYNIEYLKEVLTIFSNSFVEKLECFLHKGTRNDIITLVREGRRSLKVNNLFFHKLKKISRLNKKPGYVIAVQGTDGSGKSTIINAITPWLEESYHKGIIYNHLRPNAIPDLGVILGKKEKPKKDDVPVVNTDPHALKPSGFVGSIIRWAYYMIDYTFGYLKTVYPFVSTKSKVFIFDRYYYDYYIDQRRSRTNLPNWILRFGEIFVPKPDLVLCLGGDPEKIYSRKPETSLEEVNRQTAVLQKLCNNSKNAVWIDTTTTPEESIAVAKTAIFKMMSKRFDLNKIK